MNALVSQQYLNNKNDNHEFKRKKINVLKLEVVSLSKSLYLISLWRCIF